MTISLPFQKLLVYRKSCITHGSYLIYMTLEKTYKKKS